MVAAKSRTSVTVNWVVTVGAGDGEGVGKEVGDVVGAALGCVVGAGDGTSVGAGVGAAVVGAGDGGFEIDGAGDGAIVAVSTPSTVTLVRLVVAFVVISDSSVPSLTAWTIAASRLAKGSSPLATAELSIMTVVPMATAEACKRRCPRHVCKST